MSKSLITKKKLREIAKDCDVKLPIQFGGCYQDYFQAGSLLEEILEASDKINVHSLDYYKTFYKDIQEIKKILNFVEKAVDHITNKKSKL